MPFAATTRFSLRRHLVGLLVCIMAMGVVAVLPQRAEAAVLAPKGCPRGTVALTFDDGPGPGTTETLEILRARGAGATFFFNGDKVVARASLALEAFRDGHAIGNHTWSHPRLTTLPDGQVRQQLWLTERAMLDAGIDMLPLLRPPSFAADERVRRIAAQEGYAIAWQTINPSDWNGRSVAHIRDYVLARLHPGAIVVLHERVSNTVAALPAMLDGIHRRGYCTGVLDGRGRVVAFSGKARGVYRATFFDVRRNHTFFADIDKAGVRGITRGCNPPANSRYCPQRSVNRAEMATFLVRAFAVPSTITRRFGDVAGSSHRAEIEALATAGIARGCDPPTNRRYCPTATVTRGQMAAFITRAAGLPQRTPSFRDARGHTFAGDIGALEHAGITTGCGDDRFCPNSTVTRGQMAAFLNRSAS